MCIYLRRKQHQVTLKRFKEKKKHMKLIRTLQDVKVEQTSKPLQIVLQNIALIIFIFPPPLPPSINISLFV